MWKKGGACIGKRGRGRDVLIVPSSGSQKNSRKSPSPVAESFEEDGAGPRGEGEGMTSGVWFIRWAVRARPRPRPRPRVVAIPASWGARGLRGFLVPERVWERVWGRVIVVDGRECLEEVDM